MLAAHAGALIGLWYLPYGLKLLLSLNALIALAVLGYAASRARYILAAMDRPYLGLVAIELLIMAAAIWAFRNSRPAVVCSYVAFGLHFCASIVATIFAFTFKMTRLM